MEGEATRASKKVVETWVCDVCNNEFENQHDVQKMPVLAKRYSTNEVICVEVDLCYDCIDKYYKVVSEQFAKITIDGRGTTIENKQ